VTPEQFTALLDTAARSVFRYEALQDYAMPAEDASVVAFRTGRPRPERSVRTSPWLRRIAVQTAAGIDWSRVRVITWPLTEYTRWELIGYVESQAAGEAISVVGDDLAVGVPDFWLVDESRAVLMNYEPDGRLVDRVLVTDPAEVAELADVAARLRAAGQSLNEFLARTDV